jgi:hypothetical protein
MRLHGAFFFILVLVPVLVPCSLPAEFDPLSLRHSSLLKPAGMPEA